MTIILQHPTDLYQPGRLVLGPILNNDDLEMLKLVSRHDLNILAYPFRYWSRDNDFENNADQPVEL